MFWKLFKESVIIQGIVTFLIVLTVCLMYLLYHTIPNDLLNMAILILGFWFGSKTQNILNRGGK